MDPVQEIKDRLAIEDVVGRVVDLKRSGSSLKGLCPFHQEKTPSFYVSPGRGTYHCFGCGRGGDVFSFVMEHDRVAFPEALKDLAQQTGIQLPDREEREPSLAGQLYDTNRAALDLFRQLLTSGQGTRARAYLEGRRFGVDAVEQFELGYSPEGRDTLVRRLQAAGVNDRILLAAGLALQDDSGAMRDRFRGRLMFPIKDRSGRIAGFGGRALADIQPKYLNSPQTEIFDKSSVLFGIHRAQDAIRQAGRAILVEGYLDAVRAHTAGFLNVVASLGTAVTVPQLTMLNRLTDTVVLALDPDPAGLAAAARTSLTALAEVTQARGRSAGAVGALDLRIATLPEGTGDPDELIRDHPERWDEIIAASQPAFDFYFAHTLGGMDRGSETWRQEVIDRLLPLIQQFSTSAGWQAIWMERLAHETGLDPRALQRALPSVRPGTRKRRGPAAGEAQKQVVTGTTTRALAADPTQVVERSLLAMLLKLVLVPGDAAARLREYPFEHPQHRALVDRLLAWQENGSYDYEILSESLPPALRAEADELRALDVPLPDEGKVSVAVALYLARLRYFQLDSTMKRASQVLREIGPEDSAAAVAGLDQMMAARQQVEQELENLSQQVVRTGDAAL